MVCWSAESSTLECQDLFQCLGSWNNHEQPMNLVQALVWPEKTTTCFDFCCLCLLIFEGPLCCPAVPRKCPFLLEVHWLCLFDPLWVTGYETQLPAFWLFIPRIPCICSQADWCPTPQFWRDTMNTAKQSCSTFRISMECFFNHHFSATLVSLVVVFNAKYNGKTTKRSSRRLLRLPAYYQQQK